MTTNGTQPARRPSTPMVAALVVTVIAAAAIGTILVLVLLGRGSDRTTGDASPTPTVEPSLSSSPSQPPSVMPTATPEPTPEPVAINAMARVTVNELNLRQEPAADARSVGHFSEGARVFVVQGPIEADGYPWYQVVPVNDRFTEVKCRGMCGPAIGWVAGGGGSGDRWLIPAHVRCIESPKLEELPENKFQQLVCYGDQTLAFDGVLRHPCCGYVGPYDFLPGWLAFPTPSWYFSDPFLGLRFPPGTDWPELKYADIVSVTGHFDDPAAGECTVEVNSNGPQGGITEVDAQTAAITPVGCRTEFVLETIEVTGNTGEKCGC